MYGLNSIKKHIQISSKLACNQHLANISSEIVPAFKKEQVSTGLLALSAGMRIPYTWPLTLCIAIHSLVVIDLAIMALEYALLGL